MTMRGLMTSESQERRWKVMAGSHGGPLSTWEKARGRGIQWVEVMPVSEHQQEVERLEDSAAATYELLLSMQARAQAAEARADAAEKKLAKLNERDNE